MTVISLETNKIRNERVWEENFLIYYLRHANGLVKKNYPHTRYIFYSE
jgi:hypothetical protein